MCGIYKIVFGICIALSLSCLLTACGGGGSSTGDGLVTSSTQSQSVQYTLSAKAVSKLGDAVPITFTVTNTGSTGLAMAAAPLISVYRDNTVVWTSSNSTSSAATGRNSGGILSTGSADFVFSWDQKDTGGSLVAPGNYTVKGTCLGDTEQVIITIQ